MTWGRNINDNASKVIHLIHLLTDNVSLLSHELNSLCSGSKGITLDPSRTYTVCDVVSDTFNAQVLWSHISTRPRILYITFTSAIVLHNKT